MKIQPKISMTVSLLDKIVNGPKSKQELDYLKSAIDKMHKKLYFSAMSEDKIAAEYAKVLKKDYLNKIYHKGDSIKRIKSVTLKQSVLTVMVQEVGFNPRSHWIYVRDLSHNFLYSSLKSLGSLLADLGISSGFKQSNITTEEFDFLISKHEFFQKQEANQEERNNRENKRFFDDKKLTKIALALKSK